MTPCCDEFCLSSVRKFFGIAFHVLVALCCIALALMNRVDYVEYFWEPRGTGTAASSPLFHRVVATDFQKQTSEFDAATRCPLVYGNSTDAGGEQRGVDSLCTCLMRKPRTGSQNAKVQECLEIEGAMPVYVLHYAGVIPSADYVLWAFLCITASCLTSFSRLDGYPNLRCGFRGILPGVAAFLNLCVFSLNLWVWGQDYDGFENEGNTSDRKHAPHTCATIRFVFVFIICGYFLHIPHTLTQFDVWGWNFPDGFLMRGYTGNPAFSKFRDYMNGKARGTDAQFIQDPTAIGWNEQTDAIDNTYHKIQSSVYACELNQRDEQFRIGFWQAVSEDANFTTGAMLLAVVFSAHAGVHDDSTLLVDVCSVGGVGLLQHMAHVLMLVKEYVFQDTNMDLTSDDGPIGNGDNMNADMEKRVCEHIGNTRVMIHFFVFSLVVFYCNRASPSTFNDSELKNFFEVARFSVILALLACNTMYDIFFELVHVVKHMKEAGPSFSVNPLEYDVGETRQYPAKISFLAYHAQYRGPYLWRVHLLLPFMLLFAALIFFEQSVRPCLNIDSRVGLV